jgi:hypothetical protein
MFPDTHAQQLVRGREMHVIAETFPAYLNTNPNSPASFIKGNRGYRMLMSLFGNEFNIHTVSDTSGQSEMLEEIENLNRFADSLAHVIRKEKIQVRIVDSLFTYDYEPDEFVNLKNRRDWKEKYDALQEDFVHNKWVRLDTTISMDFARLIKKQIKLNKRTRSLDLSTLNNEVYFFSDTATQCTNRLFCVDGEKLFRPVFNRGKNKACYLFSFQCRNGICRDFIFAEKRKGTWFFLDSYPSHLIGNEARGE